jgi:hypothetical protein
MREQNDLNRSLMDEFLPNHDLSAAYEISINAPTSVAYRTDWSGSHRVLFGSLELSWMGGVPCLPAPT